MGKGDIRSRRGKIWRGTTGVSRPRKKSVALRPTAPARKVKTMKDISSAVAETSVPVIEHVQPVIAGVTADVPQIVSEKVSQATAAKPKVKKAPAAKKPAAAKKSSAKKKK